MLINTDKIILKHDGYQWVLQLSKEGTSRKGEPILNWQTSYHPTLPSVCKKVFDHLSSNVESLEELRTLSEEFITDLTNVLEKEVCKL